MAFPTERVITAISTGIFLNLTPLKARILLPLILPLEWKSLRSSSLSIAAVMEQMFTTCPKLLPSSLFLSLERRERLNGSFFLFFGKWSIKSLLPDNSDPQSGTFFFYPISHDRGAASGSSDQIFASPSDHLRFSFFLRGEKRSQFLFYWLCLEN